MRHRTDAIDREFAKCVFRMISKMLQTIIKAGAMPKGFDTPAVSFLSPLCIELEQDDGPGGNGHDNQQDCHQIADQVAL